jgi:ribosome-associated protein
LNNIIHFTLEGEFIQLIQLLKLTGFASTGAEASFHVDQSLVKCNGVVELRRRYKVKKGDTIEFKGQQIQVL